MIDGNKEQLDQLLRGVYRMCVNRDDCSGCPFYVTKCSFGEPRPSTWFDEETIQAKPEPEKVSSKPKNAGLFLEHPAKPQKEEEKAKEDDESEGTWLLSTSMGSVFTKYVFICSKCGYKKESFLSMTPMSFCPECEKRKAAKGQ